MQRNVSISGLPGARTLADKQQNMNQTKCLPDVGQSPSVLCSVQPAIRSQPTWTQRMRCRTSISPNPAGPFPQVLARQVASIWQQRTSWGPDRKTCRWPSGWMARWNYTAPICVSVVQYIMALASATGPKQVTARAKLLPFRSTDSGLAGPVEIS